MAARSSRIHLLRIAAINPNCRRISSFCTTKSFSIKFTSLKTRMNHIPYLYDFVCILQVNPHRVEARLFGSRPWCTSFMWEKPRSLEHHRGLSLRTGFFTPLVGNHDNMKPRKSCFAIHTERRQSCFVDNIQFSLYIDCCLCASDESSLHFTRSK